MNLHIFQRTLYTNLRIPHMGILHKGAALPEAENLRSGSAALFFHQGPGDNLGLTRLAPEQTEHQIGGQRA